MCIPFEVLFNSVLGEPRREVTHPEVSCFADHGGREGQPRWPRLYSSRPLYRGCGINFLVAKMASDLTAKITRSCLWPLIWSNLLAALYINGDRCDFVLMWICCAALLILFCEAVRTFFQVVSVIFTSLKFIPRHRFDSGGSEIHWKRMCNILFLLGSVRLNEHGSTEYVNCGPAWLPLSYPGRVGSKRVRE